MNLPQMCPNCQKMLTIPEEFAGQLMKCPLCGGTFTVSGLPDSAPPPPAHTPETDTYAIHPEDTTRPPEPPAAVPPVEPLAPQPAATTVTTPLPPAPAPSLAPLPTEIHPRGLTWSFNPRVLPWVAPVCLLLVFFLLFCNWVGLYPGGVPAATQTAWQAGFGFFSLDGDMADLVPAVQDKKYQPSVSVLTLFYLILFFPMLGVTIASIAIDFFNFKLPPAVDKLLPWRWGIVAAANLILFLFLGLQLLLGFSLDARYAEWVDSQIENKPTKTTQQQKLDAAKRGEYMDVLYHTFALKLAVLLHLLAIVCAALQFWVTQRSTTRPLPRMELKW